MCLSVVLSRPVIRDALSTDVTMPEGGPKSAPKKSGAEKPAAKNLLPKKIPAKKPAAKRPPAEKPPAEQLPAKPPAANQSAAKKSTAKKPVAKTEDEGCQYRTNEPKRKTRKHGGDEKGQPQARNAAARPLPHPALHRASAFAPRCHACLPRPNPSSPAPEQVHESARPVVLARWLALLVALFLDVARRCGWQRLTCVAIPSPCALPRRRHSLFLSALILCMPIGRAAAGCERPLGEWIAINQVRGARESTPRTHARPCKLSPHGPLCRISPSQRMSLRLCVAPHRVLGNQKAKM